MSRFEFLGFEGFLQESGQNKAETKKPALNCRFGYDSYCFLFYGTKTLFEGIFVPCWVPVFPGGRVAKPPVKGKIKSCQNLIKTPLHGRIL